MEIEQILKRLGLAEKEIKVYLALLKIGLSSAAKIAREVELPRQTVYSLLESLVKEGFVEQSDKRGVRQFYADPNELLKLIDARKGELEKQHKLLAEELPQLLAKHKRGKALPMVQYYEGQEGLKRLFENILEQHKGKIKTFRGYGINQFYGGLEDYIRGFIERRGARGVKTKLLIANAPDNFGIVDEETRLGRDVRRLDIDEQEAGIYMVGSRVYCFSYRDNVGVMIENQAIAKFLEDTFDVVWDKTPRQ